MPPIDAVISQLVTIVCSVGSAVIITMLNRKTNQRIDEGEQKRNAARSEGKAMRDGVCSLLRSELVSAHRDYCEKQGYMSLEDKEYVQRTYDAYARLGGNDVGHRLYSELMALTIKED